MDESSGIIMFNCGTDMLIRALVALYSLRKHYGGNITFYVEDPCPIEFEQVLKSFNCEVIHTPESKDNPLIKKISLFANSLYDKTLFLDLDIVVVDKIDYMLDALNEVDMIIPHFEEKFTSNVKENLCSGRVKKYIGLIEDAFIKEALNDHKAINTGVVSFKKSPQLLKFMEDWITLAKKGVEIKAPIPDESSFQVLYPSINKWGLNIKITTGDYNIYVLSEKNYDSPKIQHFCGNKHCVTDAPLSIIWKNVFEEMRKTNVANINSLLKYSDKRLVEYLKGNNVYYKKENREQAKKINQPNITNKVNKITPQKDAKNIRSMLDDKSDDAAFRHPYGKDGNMNANYGFNQHIPFFFTREGSEIDLVGLYRGRSAFLICNGPSFVKLDRSLLNLPGVMTFGINNGPKTFRPNFWTCVDSPERFLKSIWLDSRITKFIPQAHFEKSIFDNEKWEMTNIKVGDCPNVIGYRRNEKFVAGRFLNEVTLNWGNHGNLGGGRSVMLPSVRILHLLGFRTVYLLGCDLNMSSEYTYHFDEQRSRGAVNCNNSTYDRLKEEYFPQLKPYFDEAGFRVFNCNKDSNLKVFPYISFEDAIKEATMKLGDVKNERVYGMYSKSEEKLQWKNEPPEQQKKHLETLKQLEAQRQMKQLQQTTTQQIPEINKMVLQNNVEACEDNVEEAIYENNQDMGISLPGNDISIGTSN